MSDIHAIAAELRNVEVRDRKYRLKTYKQCFVGKDAVDLLLSGGRAGSREEAVQVGRRLAEELDLFEHVAGNHEFEDDDLFYRFKEPTEAVGFIANVRSGDNPENQADNADANASEIVPQEAVPIVMGSIVGDDPEKKMLAEQATKAVDMLSAAQPEHPMDVSSIIATLRSVEVKDRKYRLKTYKRCFVGKEAVDALVRGGCTDSREEAVEVLRMMSGESGIFEHVTLEHEFKDAHLFYRFKDSEEEIGRAKAAAMEEFRHVQEEDDSSGAATRHAQGAASSRGATGGYRQVVIVREISPEEARRIRNRRRLLLLSLTFLWLIILF